MFDESFALLILPHTLSNTAYLGMFRSTPNHSILSQRRKHEGSYLPLRAAKALYTLAGKP